MLKNLIGTVWLKSAKLITPKCRMVQLPLLHYSALFCFYFLIDLETKI